MGFEPQSLPTRMRCIRYGPTVGSYVADDDTVLRPLGEDVLVRVHAVGLNPVDAKGVVGDKLPRSWQSLRRFAYRNKVAGHVPGFDFAGTVVAGKGFHPGEAVFGTVPPFRGTLADYILVPIDQLTHMPRSLAAIPQQQRQDQQQHHHHQQQQQQQQQQTTSTQSLSMQEFQHAAAIPLVGLTALQCLRPHLVAGTATNTTTEHRPRRSLLIIGASGGTGHVAIQVARCLFTNDEPQSNTYPTGERTRTDYHITALCSGRNAEWCRSLGATHIVDYTQVLDRAAGDPETCLIEALRQAPGCPFDMVLDCVTSDDPRDTQPFHYPTLLQQFNNNNNNNNHHHHHHQLNNTPLLTVTSPDGSTLEYVYRRLGGPPGDWIRAGLQRLCSGGAGGVKGRGWWFPRTGREQLFWIRFHDTVDELQLLARWVQSGRLQIGLNQVYDFSVTGVQAAMDAILSRRVKGKVVIQVYPPLSSNDGMSLSESLPGANAVPSPEQGTDDITTDTTPRSPKLD